MDCSKNRLSSGVNDPDMEVGSVRARPRDVFGISVLLTLLLAILLAMWTVGLEDPHGLSHATPVRAADVPSLEPLYGAVQTPWRSLDWSPDGRQIALTRSEEHTSELQSPYDLVCRLLLEKKKRTHHAN